MLRWNSALRLSLRLHFTQSARTDPLLEKLSRSTSKFHVFQLVGIHRPMLNVEHVTYAMNLLLKFQEQKGGQEQNPDKSKNNFHIQRHPEFVSLCSVIENNIDVLKDKELVDFLHIVNSLEVDAHSSLVQQLVTEGWRRLQRLDLLSLSKFATYLKWQNMTTSPLMGQIASIVDSSLDDLEDPVILNALLYSLYTVISPRLQEQMIGKSILTIEKLDASHSEAVLQLFDVLLKTKSNFCLRRKCDRFFMKYIDSLNLQTICNIMKMYALVDFTNQEFCVAAKARLIQEIDHCDHPDDFAELFVILNPIVSLEIRERLEKKFTSFADQMSLNKLQDVLSMLLHSKSTSTMLNKKICSLVRNHLQVFSLDLLYILSKFVVLSDLQDKRLRTKLQIHLKRHTSSFFPSDIAKIIKAMALLDPHQTDEVILSKLCGTLAQFNLLGLNSLAFKLRHLLWHTNPDHKRHLWNLLQALNNYKLNKINATKCLNSLLHEMNNKKSTIDLPVEILEAFSNAFQRFLHQLNWKNVAQASFLIYRLDTPCPALQDRIATIVMDNIDKLCAPLLFGISRVFSYMNHKPPQEKEFFDVCAQKIINNLDDFSPHFLVGTVHNLAVAGYFHEELIKAIFNTNFLQRFDAQIDAFNTVNRRKSRLFLMKLNRYICIEHPEFGVPWFHEQFCQHIKHAEPNSSHHEVAKILNEIFGGKNDIKMCVMTPFGYFIDFEYILDKEGKPIAYEENNALHFGSSSVYEHKSQLQENKPLPAGAQRYAVKFLKSKDFLRNSDIMRGTVEKQKRNLEILGYHVIQVPIFLWDRTEFGVKNFLKPYLRKMMHADDA